MRRLLGNMQRHCVSFRRSANVSQVRFSSSISSRTDNAQTPRVTRLSSFWITSSGIDAAEREDAHAKLIRAGYLHQSRAGIFHLLPLGERVQTKLEKLIEKHMSRLGASKVSLSSISAQSLWKKTNRLEGYGQELFRFTDRKKVPYILAPTHEEEITLVAAKNLKSYKSLPLRLYQIGRKYRDEIRPRHGVLRSREFVMKDLYTFDYSAETALKTYREACAAYSALFDELKLPYIVAEANTGDIGGNLSHEFHLPSSLGEDNVISCTDCDYIANEELATARLIPEDKTSNENDKPQKETAAQVWRGISKDRKSLVNVWYPAGFTTNDLNLHALKASLPYLDTRLEDALPLWKPALDLSTTTSPPRLLNVVDYRLGPLFVESLKFKPGRFDVLPPGSPVEPFKLDEEYITSFKEGEPLNTLRIQDGDHCPKCTSGKLKVQQAIELGHTFNLGTKYSEALDAHVQVPSDLVKDSHAVSTAPGSTVSVPMHMGCHGIGVSRIIGAVAHHLADEKGLNWPRAIAPFEVVVVPSKTKLVEDAVAVSRSLADSVDLAIDDRGESLIWKLKDADLIGYPVIVVLGRKWISDRLCEVQCRRLNSVELVSLDDLPTHVDQLLAQL
ncbi:class II aaRS and biotin synthetase [Poronia punctata]|nr:class II aaRS and biotin synthetase [Poronia punctata]